MKRVTGYHLVLLVVGAILGNLLTEHIVPTIPRVAAAWELGLPLNASIFEIRKTQWIAQRAEDVGLPLNASLDEIRTALKKKRDEELAAAAAKLGLPPTATRQEIRLEEDRREDIALLNLPDTATPDEIDVAVDLRERSDEAKKVGLPITASWVEILKARRQVLSTRQADLAARLHLSPSASADEITDELLRLRPAE